MKAKAVKWVPAAIVLLAALVLLCLNATRSGLWYDEGVEYFYSSVVSGPVPGWSETQNMYERITETFQPPLYNVLMHLWLLAFDSEFGFRLAGILTTLAGGIGLFLAFRKMTDPLWAAAGTAAYLFTGQVMEYALECAEYNLVLCFLCWTLFFFVKAFLEKGTGSLAGFFLCACLSVYSQYGAAFAVVPLYLALMIRMWKDGTKRKQMLLFSGGAVLLAIPLVIFFLIPQIQHQGTMEVSHSPVFFHGGPLRDFVWEFWHLLCRAAGGEIGGAIWILFLTGAAAAALLMPRGRMKSLLLCLLAVCACIWVVLFAAVACSFYGYNVWDGTLGTENMSGRYVLFYLPLLLLFGIGGTFLLAREIGKRSTRTRRIALALAVLLLVPYCGSGIRMMTRMEPKDQVREAETAWMAEKAYEKRTIVHSHSEVIFVYYLMHDPAWKEEYLQQLVTSGDWMNFTSAGEVISRLSDTGIFEENEFYYLGTSSNFVGSYSEFLAAFRQMGYETEEIYQGKGVLVRCTRTDA